MALDARRYLDSPGNLLQILRIANTLSDCEVAGSHDNYLCPSVSYRQAAVSRQEGDSLFRHAIVSTASSNRAA